MNISYILDSRYQRSTSPIIEWLAIASLVLYVGTELIDPDIARKGEYFLLLATALTFPYIWKNDPDRWLYLVLIFSATYIMAINIWSGLTWQSDLDHANRARDHLRLFWFFIAGWWIGGYERNIIKIFMLASFTLIIGLFWHGGLSSWELLLEGKRVDFGFHNAQHLAFLLLTMVLGMLTIGLRLIKDKNNKYFYARVLLWVTLTIISILALIGTQTRQAFLALFCALIVGVPIYIIFTKTFILTFRKMTILLFIVCVTLLSLSFNDTYQFIKNKSEKDIAGVDIVLKSTSDDEIPLSSMTIRLLQWKFAYDKILERPFFGHGSETKKILIQNSDLPKEVRKRFQHFLNSYLELGVAYGVFAPLLLLCSMFFLCKRIISLRNLGVVSNDIAIFSILWIQSFLIVNFFETHVNYRTCSFLMFVVGGAIYSLGIPTRKQTTSPIMEKPN